MPLNLINKELLCVTIQTKITTVDLTANAQTEIPVNATVIEKAITKVKDKANEIAKTENIEEDPAHRVASVTFFAAITINQKNTDKHALVSIFCIAIFILMC